MDESGRGDGRGEEMAVRPLGPKTALAARSLAGAHCGIVRAFGTHCETARFEDSPRCEIHPELSRRAKGRSSCLAASLKGERSRSEAFRPNGLVSRSEGRLRAERSQTLPSFRRSAFSSILSFSEISVMSPFKMP